MMKHRLLLWIALLLVVSVASSILFKYQRGSVSIVGSSAGSLSPVSWSTTTSSSSQANTVSNTPNSTNNTTNTASHIDTFETTPTLDVVLNTSGSAKTPESVVNKSVDNTHSIPIPTGTAFPSPPPRAKWRVAVSSSFDLLESNALQSQDKDITITIHTIVIRGEEVTVLFSADTASIIGTPMPKTALLRTIERGQGIQPANGGPTGVLKHPVTILGQLDNVILGTLTFEIPDNHLPLLLLEIPSMTIQGKGGGQSEIIGKWVIPLLEDIEPDRPRPHALQIMTTRPNGVLYDEVKVWEGDTQYIDTGVGGRPEVTDGVDRFFTFTLSSPKTQRSIYIFLMSDGSVRTTSREEYIAKLGAFFTPPTPIPPAPDIGPDAQETREPPPEVMPTSLSVDEILERFSTATPKKSQ